jgi:hypothetical protein
MRETNTQDAAPDPQASPPRHTPYPGASARWVGSIAALLIVAVLAGLFLAQRGHKSPLAQPTATTGSQRACASSEITASLPARSYLMDLAMTGPDSGWAVGSVQDEGLPPFNSHVLIAQFRQCRWQPLDLTFPHAALTSITMISPREGWAAGWSEENGPLLLHYQDGAWSRVTPPEGGQAPAGARRAYGAVSSLATGDVWLVELTVWQDKQGNGWGFNTLLHLASSRWTRISVSEDSVLALAPVGGDDIWLLGTVTNATGQRLARYRGGTLVSATPFTQDGAHLSHLRMFAPNDGWATGSAEETRGGLVYSRPVALHYDGARWTQTETGAPPDAQDVVMVAPGEAWSYTQEPASANPAASGVVPTQRSQASYPSGAALSSAIAMAPSSGPHLRILATQRERAGHWQTIPFPSGTAFESFDLANIACASPDECWTTGVNTYPLPSGGTSGGQVLLRFADGAWHVYGRAA